MYIFNNLSFLLSSFFFGQGSIANYKKSAFKDIK